MLSRKAWPADRFVKLDKFGDRHGTTFADATAMQFDASDFVERLCREITGSAMWTANDRHFLNDQQCRTSAIAARYESDLHARASAVFAAILYPVIPRTQ